MNIFQNLNTTPRILLYYQVFRFGFRIKVGEDGAGSNFPTCTDTCIFFSDIIFHTNVSRFIHVNTFCFLQLNYPNRKNVSTYTISSKQTVIYMYVISNSQSQSFKYMNALDMI